MSLEKGKVNEKPTDIQGYTEKGRQMHEDDSKRHLKAFMKAYESWKRIAKEARTKSKKFCLKEELDDINKQVQSGYDRVNQNYGPLQRNFLDTPDIVQKMDACNTLTTEICDLVSKRLDTGPDQKTFNPETEKERVRMILNHDEYVSIFGGPNTEMAVSHF